MFLLRTVSGIFGQTAIFGQRPCLFRISNIGMKNKINKQTVKILMRRLIWSRLIGIYTVCKCVSDFTWCPNLPNFSLLTCTEHLPTICNKGHKEAVKCGYHCTQNPESCWKCSNLFKCLWKMSNIRNVRLAPVLQTEPSELVWLQVYDMAHWWKIV